MRTGLVYRAGQKGTKKLVAKYGERLFCVRYRYDEEAKKRLKTVELIEEETPWAPKEKLSNPDYLVNIRIDYNEKELRRKVMEAGGRWDHQYKVWYLKYSRVVKMGLKSKIVE